MEILAQGNSLANKKFPNLPSGRADCVVSESHQLISKVYGTTAPCRDLFLNTPLLRNLSVTLDIRHTQ